jgi:hypothetical protein
MNFECNLKSITDLFLNQMKIPTIYPVILAAFIQDYYEHLAMWYKCSRAKGYKDIEQVKIKMPKQFKYLMFLPLSWGYDIDLPFTVTALRFGTKLLI